MKKFVVKLLALVLVAVITVCGFTACQSGLKWQKNETYHWHVVSGVEKDKAKHTFVNGKCSVCGFNDIGDEGVIDGSNDLEWD